MDDWTYGYAEPRNVLTVNLHSICPRSYAYIDTNGEEILAWIERHGLADPTGRYERSGSCKYLEYQFRPDVLQELDSEGQVTTPTSSGGSD